MTSENFVYWLQGFLEISNTNQLTPEQVDIIKQRISLVLTRVNQPPIIMPQSGTFTIPNTTFC